MTMNTDLSTLAPSIRRFAYSLSGFEHDADDLLQGTLERLLKKGIPEGVEPLKWAFRVCRNLWLDDYRAKRIRQETSLEAEHEPDFSVDGEALHYHQLRLAEVNAAMETLPDDQRMVLSLVAVEGFSYKEVAETLSIPMGTVMSRLARARVALSAVLNPPDSRSFA